MGGTMAIPRNILEEAISKNQRPEPDELLVERDTYFQLRILLKSFTGKARRSQSKKGKGIWGERYF